MRWLFFTITLLGLALLGVSLVRSDTLSVPLQKITQKKEPGFSIGWVGDMVPASDDAYNETVFSFVTPYTKTPTLMIGNLEGTFAREDRLSKCAYLSEKCHAFRGKASFAQSLKSAGFDFVSLINNHSYDYGDEGLLDTQKVLEEYGIPYISPTKPSVSIVVHEKKIGVLGVSSTPPISTITDYDFIKKEITKLKTENDIVILIFHGGAEGADKTKVLGEYEYLGTENRGNVVLVAQTAIDAGADIVLGSGPHVLRKVAYYKERPIIYSAGNFVGGNERLNTKGILGVSGIFTITKGTAAPFTHSITPVVLSKEGVPSFDPEGAALQLVESLSKE
mgnify:CR=1 FL=1